VCAPMAARWSSLYFKVVVREGVRVESGESCTRVARDDACAPVVASLQGCAVVSFNGSPYHEWQHNHKPQ
jgi:hypothetical protein